MPIVMISLFTLGCGFFLFGVLDKIAQVAYTLKAKRANEEMDKRRFEELAQGYARRKFLFLFIVAPLLEEFAVLLAVGDQAMFPWHQVIAMMVVVVLVHSVALWLWMKKRTDK